MHVLKALEPRWLLLAAISFFFYLIFFFWSCMVVAHQIVQYEPSEILHKSQDRFYDLHNLRESNTTDKMWMQCNVNAIWWWFTVFTGPLHSFCYLYSHFKFKCYWKKVSPCNTVLLRKRGNLCSLIGSNFNFSWYNINVKGTLIMWFMLHFI